MSDTCLPGKVSTSLKPQKASQLHSSTVFPAGDDRSYSLISLCIEVTVVISSAYFSAFVLSPRVVISCKFECRWSVSSNKTNSTYYQAAGKCYKEFLNCSHAGSVIVLVRIGSIFYLYRPSLPALCDHCFYNQAQPHISFVIA